MKEGGETLVKFNNLIEILSRLKESKFNNDIKNVIRGKDKFEIIGKFGGCVIIMQGISKGIATVSFFIVLEEIRDIYTYSVVYSSYDI